ncbi:Zn-dependent hydrolase [Microvirga sp. M2]|uniref:Zn-dependent hydrolase n=1 Tax=Microvirga sp. M2 TaxID=3073270 RepID=UPI0039C2DF8F
MATNLPINGERLWADLMALAAMTDPERRWTRRAFSSRFLEGRSWLEQRMRSAGLEARLDAAGNLIGRKPGRGPGRRTIVIGSHTDTVPEGGRFDGVAGVAAGLEIVRALADAGIELEHDLEVIDCLAEEVSPYGLSCIGSRSIAGRLDDAALVRVDDAGETLSEGLRRMGGDPHKLSGAKRDDIVAYLELHIEQGPVLETEGRDIGIVTAIAGITRYEIVVDGRADHAGTFPMIGRADALVAAADLTLRIRNHAANLSSAGRGHFAATVGEMRIEPNAANVVPSRAVMLIDARAEQRSTLESFTTFLTGACKVVASEWNVAVAPPRLVSDNEPTPADPALMRYLEEACDRVGAVHRRMASGAGHDMAWFAKIAPAAMIFVPSRNGRSHTPDEWTEPSELALGAAVLFEAVRSIDQHSNRI